MGVEYGYLIGKHMKTLLNSGVSVRYRGICLTRLQPDVYFHVFGGFLGGYTFSWIRCIGWVLQKRTAPKGKGKKTANKRDIQMETLI